MQITLAKLYSFGQEIYRQFVDGGCIGRAAALAFTSLLSLVPLMTVSFVVVKALPIFQGLATKIQNLIFENFVTNSAQILSQYLEKFTGHANHLSIAGLISLLFSAVLMIFTMEQAFNAIWQVKEKRRSIPAFLIYWATLTLLPILMALTMLFASFITHSPWYATAKNYLSVHLIADCLPFLVNFCAFTFLYISVPNCRVPWRVGVLSGFIGAVLFEMAKYGFALYIFYFPTYSLLYGALAVIPIFLIWVYCAWLILLFAAVVGRVSMQTLRFFN